jgi:hypothetical protein
VYRIWTYQEAVLAHNPVVICGSSSIAWGRLATTIVFLSEMNNSPLFEQWLELLYNRAMFQLGSGCDEPTPTEMTSCRKFCFSLLEIPRRLSSMYAVFSIVWIFILPIVVAQLFNPRAMNRSLLIGLLIVIFMSTFIVGRLMWHVLSPNPPFPSDWKLSHSRSQKQAGDFANTDIHDRVLWTITSRRATHPKDMSFGIHSILANAATPDLPHPSIDYSLPVTTIYEQLTVYLIRKSKTLDVLQLAARQSALRLLPTWIPDYSRGLSLYKSHPRDHCWTSWSTWQSSESHFKIGSSNGFTILTVKGYVTGRITETARFCKTSTVYETIENDAHAWNLALMMQWGKAHYRQPRASNASFSRYLDNTRTILNIESPLQPQLKIP